MSKGKKRGSSESARGSARRYAERADALRAAVRTPGGSWAARARTLAAYGDACRFAGRISESEEAFLALLAEADSPGATRERAVARIGLGNAHAARSRWQAAIDELALAIDDAAAIDDRPLGAHARCVRAAAYFNRGQLDEAERALRSALATAREYETLAVEAPATVSLGVIALARGDVDEAYAQLTQGTTLAERARDAHWAAMGRSYLAIQAHLAGRVEAAEATYDRSLAELDALGMRRAAGLCRLARATLSMSQGAWAEARAILEQAVSALAVTCPDYEPVLQAALALCDLATGDVPAFRHRLEYAQRMIDAHEPSSRAPVVARVRLLDGSPGPDGAAAPSVELALLERVCLQLERSAVAPSLVLEREGRLFRVPGSTRLVDLSRRTRLRKLLLCLAERHAEGQGAIVSDGALIAHLWPDERMTDRSASIRLHNAVSTLRATGLRPFIERAGDGYRLRSDLVLRIVASGADELISDV